MNPSLLLTCLIILQFLHMLTPIVWQNFGHGVPLAACIWLACMNLVFVAETTITMMTSLTADSTWLTNLSLAASVLFLICKWVTLSGVVRDRDFH